MAVDSWLQITCGECGKWRRFYKNWHREIALLEVCPEHGDKPGVIFSAQIRNKAKSYAPSAYAPVR